MGAVQHSGSGKGQELGVFVESSCRAARLPVCLLCLGPHAPSLTGFLLVSELGSVLSGAGTLTLSLERVFSIWISVPESRDF